MQQFNVPQFIDVEDKVIGPITARQFVILLFSAMCSGIAYALFPFGFFIFATVIAFGLGGVLSFVKINGRPFHFFVVNVIQTMKKPKVRVWNNKLSKTKDDLSDKKPRAVKKNEIAHKPIYARSKLSEISLIVDTGGAYGGGDENIEIADNLNIK
ncbi:MAG: PrgI family protein [bacterium]|nr:PrgI family protein [bacterium]